MTAVSNASPIISLDATGHLDLVRRLYDHLLIPPAVYDEVTVAPNKPGADAVRTEEWIPRRPLNQSRLASALLGELDPARPRRLHLPPKLTSNCS
jgi:predicted nucleic acid-binding protein